MNSFTHCFPCASANILTRTTQPMMIESRRGFYFVFIFLLPLCSTERTNGDNRTHTHLQMLLLVLLQIDHNDPPYCARSSISPASTHSTPADSDPSNLSFTFSFVLLTDRQRKCNLRHTGKRECANSFHFFHSRIRKSVGDDHFQSTSKIQSP